MRIVDIRETVVSIKSQIRNAFIDFSQMTVRFEARLNPCRDRNNLETAIAYAKALAPYGLRWYEEAGDPLDYELQPKLAPFYPGPMATGENLFSLQDARNLIRYAGLRSDRDILQFDARSATASSNICEFWTC